MTLKVDFFFLLFLHLSFASLVPFKNIFRYIGGLARMIEKFAGDSIQHEAFVEAFGERHLIKFELHDDAVEGRNSNSTHQWVSNSSGELVIHIYAHHFNSEDSYYTGRNLDEACSDGGPLTVAARKNIKDKSALRDKHLARIQKATGVDYEVEVDWADWTAALKHKGSYAQDNVGTTVYGEYLDALAENIEKLCKDDMCKEALVEATGKKTIHFRIIPQDQLGNINSKCHSVKFSEDGTMIVATSDDNICKDTRNCGNDMQSNL